jgi:hypothetical protein
MAVLAKALCQNRAERRVGVNDKNPARGASGIGRVVQGHGHHLGITMKSEAEVPAATTCVNANWKCAWTLVTGDA